MLRAKLIDKSLVAENVIATDRSRCLRMRFNGNSCTRCTAICPSGAITINEDVVINADNCSACMLCVATCPADCFALPGENFNSVIGRLQKTRLSVPTPVLGCGTREDTVGHAKIHCLGSLSEAHLIALAVFLENGLQLDATKCTGCWNGFILEALKERIAGAEAGTSLELLSRLKLIQNRDELDYREPSCGRRGFFSDLKMMTLRQAADLFAEDRSNVTMQSYSAKQVPFKKALLNRALKAVPGELQRPLLESYYYLVRADEGCDSCFSCIGMCPTGALRIEEMEGTRGLFFSSSLCNACGLCESFCRRGCISITKGFFGENPFKFINIKRKLSCLS